MGPPERRSKGVVLPSHTNRTDPATNTTFVDPAQAYDQRRMAGTPPPRQAVTRASCAGATWAYRTHGEEDHGNDGRQPRSRHADPQPRAGDRGLERRHDVRVVRLLSV